MKTKLNQKIKFLLGLAVIGLHVSCTLNVPKDKIQSLLRVSTVNPRYFEDKNGKIVYLTGSHTWSNLVDISALDPPEAFDFNAYLDWMQQYNHNFIRLWTWELLKWDMDTLSLNVYPHPWLRTGPGNAFDGKAKFDLNKFDQEYFRRLKNRVESAGKRGIYVSIMLFEGCGMQFVPNAWQNHPFHPGNNINGINRDIDGDEKGLEIFTLSNPEIIALQENYVKKVIDLVNNFDNVLFEISNENYPPSTEWQYHFINFIHDYEKHKSKQHPVGMTFQYEGGSNETLFNSPADWISPNHFVGGKDVRNNPPATEGKKVILYDTDHLWGIGGNQAWVWKSFVRGMNPIFMDPYNGLILGKTFDPEWETIRKNMGYTRNYAEKINLLKAVPHNELSSTSYCLADPGSEYIVYQPTSDSSFIVNLKKGEYLYEWFNPTSGSVKKIGKVEIDQENFPFTSPFSGDAVLYLKVSH